MKSTISHNTVEIENIFVLVESDFRYLLQIFSHPNSIWLKFKVGICKAVFFSKEQATATKRMTEYKLP